MRVRSSGMVLSAVAVSLALALAGTAQAATSTIPGGTANMDPAVGVTCAGSGSTIRVYYAYAITAGQEMGGDRTTPCGPLRRQLPPSAGNIPALRHL